MDFGSVVHAHSPYANAFGNLKQKIGQARIKHCGMRKRAFFASFADPGSKELANQGAIAFPQKDALCALMEDPGVTVGVKTSMMLMIGWIWWKDMQSLFFKLGYCQISDLSTANWQMGLTGWMDIHFLLLRITTKIEESREIENEP